MNNLSNRVLLIFVLCLSGSHLHAWNNLTADEVRKLFTGNTAEGEQREYEKPGSGSTGQLINFAEKFVSFYAENGTVKQQIGAQHQTGKWRVAESGELCTEWEGKDEKCTPVYKEGKSYKKVIKNKKGRPLREIKFIKFTSGNINNL